MVYVDIIISKNKRSSYLFYYKTEEFAFFCENDNPLDHEIGTFECLKIRNELIVEFVIFVIYDPILKENCALYLGVMT